MSGTRSILRKCWRDATDVGGRPSVGVNAYRLARFSGSIKTMTDLESAARTAVRITRAAPLFDQLVDMLLSHVALAAHSTSSTDAARRAELLGTRARLDAHYPEFQRIFFELLHKHLGQRLPEVLAALDHELVQAYLVAQTSMEEELISELEGLAERMASDLSIDAGRGGSASTIFDDCTLPRRESAATSLDATLPWVP
jgi:hypothetical protein